MKIPTATASVRGTVFSALYDGAAAIVSVESGSVLVDPTRGPAVTVPAGREVAATATAAGPLVAIGKAGAPAGSVGAEKARALLTAALTSGLAACKAGVYSITLKPVAAGWNATLKVVGARRGRQPGRSGARRSRRRTRLRRRSPPAAADLLIPATGGPLLVLSHRAGAASSAMCSGRISSTSRLAARA